MKNLEIYFYVTNLTSIDNIDHIRDMLDNDPNVHYWYFDEFSVENKLIMVGCDLDEMINWMQEQGYISQMDEIY